MRRLGLPQTGLRDCLGLMVFCEEFCRFGVREECIDGDVELESENDWKVRAYGVEF